MRKTILILALLLAACAGPTATGDQERSYSVFEYPDAKDKGTLPSYRVKQQPDGSVEIFKYGDPFEPAYIIRGDGIYRPGDPFQPVGNIKNGVPTHTQKGGK